MPTFLGTPNADGSPHHLQKGIMYSSMPVEWMRASTVWTWFLCPVREHYLWIPYGVPENETPQQLVAWLRRNGPRCVARVKTFTPPQCRECRRPYTRQCQTQNHEKEMFA